MSPCAPHDEFFMNLALEQAQLAAAAGDVPVGAVLVIGGQVIAKSGNKKEQSRLPTHHAEILVIEEAARQLQTWRLTEAELFVTLEPCLMCCGAIIHARLQRVVYAAVDPKAGAVQSLYQTLSDSRLNHQPIVVQGPLANEASQLLSDFFKKRRQETKKP